MADKIDQFNFLNLFNATLLKKLKSLESFITKHPSSLDKVDPNHLRARIIQAILNSEGSEIRTAASQAILSGFSLEEFFSSSFQSKRMSINWNTKRITLRRRLTFSLYAKYLAYWLRSSVLFLRYMLLKKRMPLPNTSLKIWNTTVSINGIDPSTLERFIGFCRTGQISDLHNPLIISFPCPERSINCEYFTSERPLFTCIQSPKAKMLKLIYLFYYQQLKWMFFVNFLFLKNSPLLLLARDFSQYPLICSLQRFGIISDYFLSISDFNEQPLWLQDKSFGIKSHMVWYSSNSRTYTFNQNEYNSEYESPFLSLIQIHKHWLWDSMWGDWAKSIFPNSNCNFVGPILLYSNEQQQIRSPSNTFRVSIFDVAPLNEKESFSKYFGMGFNYLSNKIATDFITHILDVTSHVCRSNKTEFIINIKQKRIYNGKSRSSNYSNFLKNLIQTNQLTPITHLSSIYEVVRGSDMVICFPFTSPAYIAKQLNVPVCFYDSANILSSNHSSLPLCKDKKELESFIASCLSSFIKTKLQKDQSN